MKKRYALIIAIIAVMIISCGSGSSEIKKVKNGYLKAFGNEVTIGEAFDSVFKKSVTWSQGELSDERWSSEEYSLVEVKTSEDGSEINIQFIVEKNSQDFRLHGATVDGQFVDAQSIINAVISEYNNG